MNTINNKSECILKKLESGYALWFQNSKSFLLLEEPAYEVFQDYSNGVDREEIIKTCQNKYGHLEGDIPKFVDEIIQHIQYYNTSETANQLSKKEEVDENAQHQEFLKPVRYKLGLKSIEIYYGDENLKFAIHPLIAHLETESIDNSNDVIECYQQNNLVIYKYNSQLIEAFHTDNMEYYTGGIRQLLYSILYDRGYNDWMTMLHASGIYQNNQAILFSAGSGSGKSTISAILKAKGYGYLSDDFIAADNDGKTYPFPAAISVKEGSFPVLSEYYSELKTIKEQETFIGKTVRYLPVYNINEESNNGISVKAFVFVNYSESKEFVFEEVSKKQAIQMLLKETWVNPTQKSVSCFFEWIENTAFYNLQYSKTEEALEVVQEIFRV